MLASRQVFATIVILVLAAPMLVQAQPRRGLVLVPPVKPACISSPYGPRVLAQEPEAGTYHYGVDLPAPEGTPVLAAASGTVIRVQRRPLGGIEMLVQHDGFVGIYSHFDAVMPELASGQRSVVAGQQIGFVGNTGVSTGGHVYFAMIMGGKPVDPEPYLKLRACNGDPVPSAPPPRIEAATPKAPPGVAAATVGARKYYQLLLPTEK